MAVQITFTSPVVMKDGKIHVLETTKTIYHYKNISLYKYQYESDSAGILRKKCGYFVFHKDSSYGLSYNDPQFKSASGTERLEVSFMKTRLQVGLTDANSLLCRTPSKIAWHAGKDILQETFLNQKSSRGENFTLRLYYSKKLKAIEESLAPVLDKAKGMKLYKYHLIADGYFDKQYNFQVPKTETLIELRQVRVLRSDEFLPYFKRYLAVTKE